MFRVLLKKSVAFLLTGTLVGVHFLVPVAAVTPVARAAFNPEINYQGRLLDAAGDAVADDTYNMQFKLHTALSGGSVVWTETHCYSPDGGTTCNGTGTDSRIETIDGLFSVMLGSVNSLADVDFNQELYLSINIGGTGTSPSYDGEMSPRKVLGAVPAAFVADTLDGVESDQFFRNDIVNATSSATTSLAIRQDGAGKIAEFFGPSYTSVMSILSSGEVGIGTTSPYAKLSVVGETVAEYFTATSTTASSTFPRIDTTDIEIAGKLYDGSASAGTNGMVLQTTSTGVQWVATSSLGITGGGGMSIGSAVTSGTSGSVLYVDSSGNLAQDNAGFYFDATNNYLNLGTSTDALVIGDITGNARGQDAIDIQSNRSAATQVAGGNQSVALGYQNRASAIAGLAIGVLNDVTAGYASSFGYSNNITGTYATALGYDNSVTVQSSTAVGAQNSASGAFSLAVGYSNQVSGSNAASIGDSNVTTGNYSYGIGYGNNNSGSYSATIGIINEITGGTQNSLFGYNNAVKSASDNATLLGNSNEIWQSNKGTVVGYDNYLSGGDDSNIFGAENVVINAASTTVVGTGNTVDTISSSYIFGESNSISTAGTYSLALGHGNTISQDASVAIGSGNVAEGYYSFVGGVSSYTGGAYSLAFGYSNDATGLGSLSLGFDNIASGTHAAAVGTYGQATGMYSNAFGYRTQATAQGASVFGGGGNGASTNMVNSVANSTLIGPGATTSIHILGTGEVMLPYFTATSTTGTSTISHNLAVLGTSTVTDVLPSTSLLYSLGSSVRRWNEAWISTLNVGTSTWSLTQSDSGRFSIFDQASGAGNERLSITAAGNVGIGTSTPASVLNVYDTQFGWNLRYGSDPNVNRLGWYNNANLQMWIDGNNTGNTSQIGFFTSRLDIGSNAISITSGSNVGIGTTSPYAKLSVVGETVAEYFTATSTTASSTFPRIDTTDIEIAGKLYDGSASAGTNGMVLQTTSTGVQWVATSSLGITGGGGSPGGSNTQIQFNDSGSFGASSDFTFSTSAGLIGNESGGAAVDFRWETDTLPYGFFIDASTNQTFIGYTTAPTNSSGAKLDVNGTIDAIGVLSPNTYDYGFNLGLSGLSVFDNTSNITSSYGLGQMSLSDDANGDYTYITPDYINFSSTVGSAGFGLRNNAGTIEYKNSGGSWTALSAIDAGGTLTSSDFFRYNHFENTGTTSMDPFTGAAISSGTLTTPLTTAMTTGQTPGVVRLRSSTTANSGYRLTTTAGYLLLDDNMLFEGVAQVQTSTNTTVRLGFHDTTSSSDAVDGVYFEIVGTTASGKTSNNSTRSTTASNYTITAGSANWYRFRIVLNSTASTATYSIYDLSGTQLWTDTLSTNIPTATGRETSAGIVATNSGSGTALDLVHVDYMGLGTVAGYDAETSSGAGLWTTSGSNAYYNVGKVGIGTSTPSGQLSISQASNNAAGGLWIAATDGDYRSIYMGTDQVLNFNGGSGNTATLNAAGAWTNASDIAYKENIEQLDYGLEEIMLLNPRRYTWKSDGTADIGFIAQELEQVIPEVVFGQDGSKTVSYGQLTSLAISGLQDIGLRIDLFDAPTSTPSLKLDVDGKLIVNSGFTVQDEAQIGSLNVLESATFEQGLQVLGTSTSSFGGALLVEGSVTLGAGDITITSNGVEATNGFAINESQFYVATSGVIGIGTTSPARMLHIVRSDEGSPVRFQDANGYCEINPTTASLICTSDESLKENITELTSASVLEQMRALKPVTFEWLTDTTDAERVGFIAQEVEVVIPELVYTDAETGLKSVAYGGFVPYIVSAIKELVTRVDTLATQIESLAARVESLASQGYGAASNAFQTLRVGSPQQPSGITIYDEETGAPYCLTAKNGSLVTRSGECGTPIEEVDQTTEQHVFEEGGEGTTSVPDGGSVDPDTLLEIAPTSTVPDTPPGDVEPVLPELEPEPLVEPDTLPALELTMEPEPESEATEDVVEEVIDPSVN